MDLTRNDDFLKILDRKHSSFLEDARKDIAIRIRNSIRKDRITHAEAAELTGFGRTVITAVCNGKIDKISTDRLLKIGVRLGLNIQIQVD